MEKIKRLKSEIDKLSPVEKRELLSYLKKSMKPIEPLYPTKSGTLQETKPAEEPKERLKNLKRKYYW